MSRRSTRSGSRFESLPQDDQGDNLDFLTSHPRALSTRFQSLPRTSHIRPAQQSFRSTSWSTTFFPPSKEQPEEQSNELQFKWDHYERVPVPQDDSSVQGMSAIFEAPQNQMSLRGPPTSIAEDVEILREVGFYIQHPYGKLGSGCFGECFRGYYGSTAENFFNVENSRRFAVKVVDLEGFDAKDIENFENEKYILTKVNHINVVPIKYIINMGEQRVLPFENDPDKHYQTADRSYLIMDFADHGDLEKWLSKNKENLEPFTRIKFMKDMAFGMRYLLEEHIVHGDVHSGNVLIFTGSDGLIAKWTDFGLSNIASGQRIRSVSEEYFKARASFDLGFLAKMYDEILENRDMSNRPETPHETQLLDECQRVIDDNYYKTFNSIHEFFYDFRTIIGEELVFDEHHFD